MNTTDPLLPHRQAIDEIDEQILSLLNQRAGHARSIGQLKGTGVVYRPEREAQVLQRIQQLNTQGLLPNEAVARLFREIMSECLAVERPLTIAYLGPEGTFTHQAAIKHFGHAAHTLACTTIDECIRTVEARQADYAIVPVENSTEGSVGRTLDLLVTGNLKACGEVVLRIHHHLLNRSGNPAQIQTVYAHAQALAQCHEWLNRHLSANVARIPVSSNAQAATIAAEDPTAAAIAGQAAAERYGLSKVADSIEDEPNNTTRFLVLGHQQTQPCGRDKTSLIVSAPNRVGAVHGLLQPFSEYGISMTKLESRPSRAVLWEYVFFIDVEGHIAEPAITAAIEKLQQRAAFVKIIGAYPQAVL